MKEEGEERERERRARERGGEREMDREREIWRESMYVWGGEIERGNKKETNRYTNILYSII